MSVQHSKSDSSTVDKSNNSRTVIRRAKARQHTEDVQPAIPEPTQVAFSGVDVFDDDGNLVTPDTSTRSTPSIGDYSTEEISWALFELDTTQYNKWRTAVDENMFPDKSTRDLLIIALSKALENAEMSLNDVIRADYLPNRGAEQYSITNPQQKRDEKMGTEMPSSAEVKAAILPDGVSLNIIECPECEDGSLQKEGRQMGAADEGQTVFITCDCCDYMSKGGYGG